MALCRFLALPHPGLSLYRNCIELELNLASSGDKISLGNVRKLFETALTTYDQDVKLWQDYYNMEVKVRDVSFSSSFGEHIIFLTKTNSRKCSKICWELEEKGVRCFNSNCKPKINKCLLSYKLTF